MPETILPCPFCGAGHIKARRDREAYIGGCDWIALCQKCGANGANSYTEAEAIAAWNTRRPEPITDEMVARLEQAMRAVWGKADEFPNEPWHISFSRELQAELAIRGLGLTEIARQQEVEQP